ncbi:MAG: hypothetical protein KF713_00480 [Turneriella sp.]|nr:hypothetical protein [Turneriella sp.]
MVRQFIRRMFLSVCCGAVLCGNFSLAAKDSTPHSFWYVGAGGGFAPPFFFGLINDIYATVPASPVVNIFGGFENRIVGSHHLGGEFTVAQSFPVDAREENFIPTVSQTYPTGSTVWYRNVMQTVAVASARYSFDLSERWSLFARVGAGIRGVSARIELVSPAGAVYEAASPSGVMPVFSAGFGIEFNASVWGRFALAYQSMPPAVYRTGVGTTTIRASDLFLLQWRYAFY